MPAGIAATPTGGAVPADSAAALAQDPELKAVVEVLFRAATTGDAAATAHLQSHLDANYVAFAVILARVLRSDDLLPPPSYDAARALAGIVLKNSLISTIDVTRSRTMAERWLAVPNDVRQFIRDSCLSSLLSKSKNVRMQGAQVLAAIASIEIPRKQWRDLLGVLLQGVLMSGDQNVSQAEACLTALGYVVETVRPATELQEYSQQVLGAIGHGMRFASPDVRRAAVKALMHSLSFIQHHFELPADRAQIMTMLCENTQYAQDAFVRRLSLECLSEVVDTYYSYMAEFADALWAITAASIQKQGADDMMAAIEIWSTIADTEGIVIAEIRSSSSSDAVSSYTYLRLLEKFAHALVPFLLQCMTQQSSADQEADTWDVSTAASQCLALVGDALGDAIVPLVMPFVLQNISSPNWHFREAAIMAFGNILEGPMPETIAQNAAEAVPIMLGHASARNDREMIVKDSAMWTLCRIADLHPSAISGSHQAQTLEVALTSILQDPPRIANHASWILINLISRNVVLERDHLSNVLGVCFQALAMREDVGDDGLDAALCDLLVHAATSYSELKRPILERLAQLLQESINKQQRDGMYLALLMGTLGELCELVSPVPGALFTPLMEMFMYLLQHHLPSCGYEGFLAVMQLLRARERPAAGKADPQSEALVAGYLSQLLGHVGRALANGASDPKLVQMACHTLADVAHATEELGMLDPATVGAMTVHLLALASGSTTPAAGAGSTGPAAVSLGLGLRVRAECVSVLGDFLSIYVGSAAHYQVILEHVPRVLEVLSQLAPIRLAELPVEQHEDLLECKSALADSYTSILSTAKENPQFLEYLYSAKAAEMAAFLNIFYEDFPTIITSEFTQASLCAAHNACAGLLGDIVSAWESKGIRQLIKTETVVTAKQAQQDICDEAEDEDTQRVAENVVAWLDQQFPGLK